MLKLLRGPWRTNKEPTPLLPEDGRNSSEELSNTNPSFDEANPNTIPKEVDVPDISAKNELQIIQNVNAQTVYKSNENASSNIKKAKEQDHVYSPKSFLHKYIAEANAKKEAMSEIAAISEKQSAEVEDLLSETLIKEKNSTQTKFTMGPNDDDDADIVEREILSTVEDEEKRSGIPSVSAADINKRHFGKTNASEIPHSNRFKNYNSNFKEKNEGNLTAKKMKTMALAELVKKFQDSSSQNNTVVEDATKKEPTASSVKKKNSVVNDQEKEAITKIFHIPPPPPIELLEETQVKQIPITKESAKRNDTENDISEPKELIKLLVEEKIPNAATETPINSNEANINTFPESQSAQRSVNNGYFTQDRLESFPEAINSTTEISHLNLGVGNSNFPQSTGNSRENSLHSMSSKNLQGSGITRGDQIFPETFPKTDSRSNNSSAKLETKQNGRTHKHSRAKQMDSLRGHCDSYYNSLTGSHLKNSDSFTSGLSLEDMELVQALRNMKGSKRSSLASGKSKSRHAEHLHRHHPLRRSTSDSSAFLASSKCSCDNCWLFLVKDQAYNRASMRKKPYGQVRCTCSDMKTDKRKVQFVPETIPEVAPADKYSASDKKMHSSTTKEKIKKKEMKEADKLNTVPENYMLVMPWELEAMDQAQRKKLITERRKRARCMVFAALVMIILVGLACGLLILYLRRRYASSNELEEY